jgi:GTP-binding protein EngB required for normal cell division
MKAPAKMTPWGRKSGGKRRLNLRHVIIIGRTPAGKPTLISSLVERSGSLVVGYGKPIEFRARRRGHSGAETR